MSTSISAPSWIVCCFSHRFSFVFVRIFFFAGKLRVRCNYRDFRSATKTSGSEKNLRASLLVNYFRISMLPLVLLLCFASLNLESEGQADDAVLTTANDLFLQARQYDSNKQYYLALRSFQAAYRLFPQDKRFLREARKLANYYRGKVKLYLENGQMLLLPVLYPNGTV